MSASGGLGSRTARVDAAIEVRGVRLTYPSWPDDGCPVLDGVGLRVPHGSVCMLAGPTGSGKTSLLRVIAGLESAATGEVFLRGRPMAGVPPAQRAVSLVFQDESLIPHWTVARNLEVCLKLGSQTGISFGATRRRQRDEIERRVNAVARSFGLVDLLDRRPVELSGGQRRLAAVAQALAAERDVVLLDEPTSNLDEPQRRHVQRQIVDWQRTRLSAGQATTLLWVTHDQQEALALGEQTAFMQSGRLEQVATARELYEQPESRHVAEFFGRPGMNCWSGRLWQEPCTPDDKGEQQREVGWRFDSAMGSMALAESCLPRRCQRAELTQGLDLVLGLRPESIDVTAEVGDAANQKLREAGCWFQGRVREKEYEGNSSLLQVEGEKGGMCRVKLAEETCWTMGQHVTLSAASSAIYWFAADGAARQWR